ncbi:hypothetical protein [Frankia sp. AgKG'84/4]|uniref:hypothetical protein n=1 Tax=Frankia sp. AgKG'84/4 TaxID=573490 RepID=UPI00201000C1|nr:hypothetical protein [Frankia sp. AgKG'84/4]MCL9796227.1 hypothetical protein [Frankia sp. AgKG'84/4]
MTALVGATSRVGDTGRRRVHVISITAGQVLNALVDPTEPTIHTLRPRLIPLPAPKVAGFYREQVAAMLTEVATTAIDAVALVTAQPAAAWRELVTRHVPEIPVTVIPPVLAATWSEYHRRGQTGALPPVTISSTVQAGIVLDGRPTPTRQSTCSATSGRLAVAFNTRASDGQFTSDEVIRVRLTGHPVCLPPDPALGDFLHSTVRPPKGATQAECERSLANRCDYCHPMITGSYRLRLA